MCCKDLWCLETEKPQAPSRCQLVRATTNTLEISWGSISNADSYLLQIQRYDMPPNTPTIGQPALANTNLNSEPIVTPTNKHQLNGQAQLAPTSNNKAQGLNASTIQQQAQVGKINPKIVVQQPTQIKVVQQKAPITISTAATNQQQQQIISGQTANQPQTTQMSGMAVLATAACATQKMQAPTDQPQQATIVKTTQGAQIIQLQQASSIQSTAIKQQHPQQMKIITPGTNQPTIRLITPSSSASTANLTGQGGAQLMTLVKTANGQLQLAPASSTAGSKLASNATIVKLLPQSSANTAVSSNLVKTISQVVSNTSSSAVIVSNSSTMSTSTTQGTTNPSKVMPTIIKAIPQSNAANIVTLSTKTSTANIVNNTTTGQQPKTIIIPSSKANQVISQQQIISSTNASTVTGGNVSTTMNTAYRMVTNPAGMKYVVIQAPNSQSQTTSGTTTQQIMINQGGVQQPITLQLPNSVVSTSGTAGTKTITIPGSGQKIIQLPAGTQLSTQLPQGIRFVTANNAILQQGGVRTISAATAGTTNSTISQQPKIVLLPQSTAASTISSSNHQIVALPSTAVMSSASNQQQESTKTESKITQLDGPLDEEESVDSKSDQKANEDKNSNKMEVVDDDKKTEQEEDEKMDVDSSTNSKEQLNKDDESSSNNDLKSDSKTTQSSDSTDTKPQLLLSVEMPGLEPPAQMCADDPEPIPSISLAISPATDSISQLPSVSNQPLLSSPSTTDKPDQINITTNSTQESNINDPLSTLASAAVSSQSQQQQIRTTDTKIKVKTEITDKTTTTQSSSTNEIKPNISPITTTNNNLLTATQSIKTESAQSSDQQTDNQENKTPSNASTPNVQQLTKKNQWYDVNLFKSNICTVSHYYLTPENQYPDIVSMNDEDFKLPNYSQTIKIDLEPGTAYKLRVAAINACGRGPWSEVSAFKTCLPGYPGAPSAIKITKNQDGANLGWEPPQFTSGTITEYSVYLAVKNSQPGTQVNPNTAPLSFVRVYCDKDPFCIVTNHHLQQAHIDMTNKPAIIFRIAAKNEKG